MPFWDYSGNGFYFITLMIENAECLLGEIKNNELVYSDFGTIALTEWNKSFIAGYKSAVTTKIDNFIDLFNLPDEKFNRENKFWQSNYHDHIIRNKKEYWKIKNYIKSNPQKWADDKFHQ